MTNSFSQGMVDCNMELLLYRHTLNNPALPAVFTANPQDNFNVLFGYEAICRLMGSSQEMPSGKSLSTCIPALSSSLLKQLWHEVALNGSAVMEIEIDQKSAQSLAMTISFSLFEYDGQRLMAGCLSKHGISFEQLAVVSNVTERKRVEAENKRLIKILNESPDYIGTVDMLGNLRYHNPAALRMIGLPADADLSTLKISDMHPQWATKLILEEVFPRVLADGICWRGETALLHQDGREIPVSQLIMLHRDEEGQPEFMSTIMQDITERKQMEATVRQRDEAFRTLVENLPTLVVRYDRNFHRIYANPMFFQTIGSSASEILGKHVAASWRATNLSVEAYIGILSEVMDSGKKTEISLEWRDNDGGLIAVAIKIVPEYAADGQVTSVLALGFDISERRYHQIVEANRLCVFEKMAQGRDIKSILEQVALFVESSKPKLHCGILLLNEERQLLQVVAAPTLPDSFRAKFKPLVLAEESDYCCGWVASALRGERVILDNLRQHSCWSLCQSFVGEINAAACWSEPIFSSANQLLGIVSVYLNQAGKPDEADLALLRQACHLSSIAIERKRIEQKMYHQASYDLLTGLPNRHQFISRLYEEAGICRDASNLALLLIDLDHFKEVNDSLGHWFGDLLLVQVAERIRSSVREADIVARLAGDEFVVIIPRCVDSSIAGLIAQHIVNALSKRFQLENCSAHISASVGVALYPQDTDDIDQLLGCADQSMYAVKKAGRNGVSFFTRSMQDQAQERLQLSNDLRVALQNGQLQVHFQPIISITSGRVEKAEALIRWQHPHRGMVKPDIFIPIAEETGEIHEIGDWVFRQASAVALQWQILREKTVYSAKTCQISVNMSPIQFVRGNPESSCIEHLHAIGLNTEVMVIEITEGLLLSDQENVIKKLRCFQDAGVQLALDDFGTGYSAMAYLKKFNIDYLKIDQSFIRDLEFNSGDRAIAEAITVMAHRLGLKVIAEGVETEGQRKILVNIGCDYLQGYLYAKPMPAEVFLAFVSQDIYQQHYAQDNLL